MVVGRLIEVMKMSLEISRSLNKIDQEVENLPASITFITEENARNKDASRSITLRIQRWNKMDDK